MTVLQKVYNCTFGTFKDSSEGGGLYTDYADPLFAGRCIWEYSPNSFSSVNNADPGVTYGYVTVDDVLAEPVGQNSADGVSGHFKRIHIPRLPSNATGISSRVIWNSITAHVVTRVENHRNYPVTYSVDLGISKACLGFPTILGTSGTGGTATDYYLERRNIPAIPAVTLATADGAIDYAGASADVAVARSGSGSGIALINSLGSDGFNNNRWRDGGWISSLQYVAIVPAISFALPNRIWTPSGSVNQPWDADVAWATGDFTLEITYTVP